MYQVNVIVIKDGVVYENILVTDNVQSEASQKAEQIFLDKCSVYMSNWDKYTQDDKDAILIDGYEIFGHGSVCISWPEVGE